MANNARVSQSVSIEDLMEKNVQLEAELGKLAEEVQEVMKRQDESSKKQDESQKRMEEASRVLDDKLNNLGLMMERTMCQISGKGPNLFCGETSKSTGANRGNGDGNSRNCGNGTNVEHEEDEMDPNFNLNIEEFQWADDYDRNRKRLLDQKIREACNCQ